MPDQPAGVGGLGRRVLRPKLQPGRRCPPIARLYRWRPVRRPAVLCTGPVFVFGCQHDGPRSPTDEERRLDRVMVADSPMR